MMQAQHKTRSRIHYDSVLSAWREQVAKATETPDLKQRLSNRERELLPRFTAHYTQLLALPRRARRTMQRQWKRSLAGMALLMALGQTPALAATINVGGACTLVDVITAANTDAATGGCSAGSGADTVVLSGDVTLTAVNNSYFAPPDGLYLSGPNGLPVITSDITIDGNGATIQRAGSAPPFRIFGVNRGANLSLQETTVSGARTAGGLDGRGGGVFSAGTLTVTSSTISGNSTPESNGGGVYNRGGTVTVTNSTISGNSAVDGGGGIESDYGSVTLSNSTITRNTVITGTISTGGGVRLIASDLTLSRTLISGNTADDGREVYFFTGFGGTASANNFNVFGFSGNAGVSGFSPGPTDIVPTVALAQVLNTNLANNGGPTQTHALVSGSPAVDAVGSGCPPPNTDQRGISRPQGAACDVGSFELEGGGGEPPPEGTCNDLPATIAGTEGRDNLRGTSGDDVIVALGGNDFVVGGGGNDTICGGEGNDQLRGISGDDQLFGESGNDIVLGGTGFDEVNGGEGDDRAQGDGDDDTVTGEAGNDTLLGNNGNDALDGGDDTDSLDGGSNTAPGDSCANGETNVNCESVM